MMRRRIILVSWLAAFLAVGIVSPREASAAPPLLVQNTEVQLLAAGCEAVEMADDKAMRAAEALDWQAAVPSDATGEALLFCPPGVMSSLQPLGTGRVAAATAQAKEGYWGYFWEDFWFFLGQEVDWVGKQAKSASLSVLRESIRPVEIVLIPALMLLFKFFATAGSWLVGIEAEFLPKLLTVGEFVDSSAVQMMWPVALAIANAGFLLALVIIALLVALRLDAGVGVRKLLPRLLIAALLVNFSLVIAGLILDASRILMALITQIFSAFPGSGDLENKLQEGLNIGATFYTIDATIDMQFWNFALAAFLQALVAWVLVIALAVVIFGLVMRYVFIIALLVASPFAYLFIAMPGALGLAKRWWSAYLRYVIYGPVVLVLVLLALGSIGGASPLYSMFDINNPTPEIARRHQMYGQIMKILVFSMFMIAAAQAGKHAGVIGSDMALSLVSRGGKRARAMAYQGAKATARSTGKGIGYAARVSGATELVKRPFRQARDYLRERGKPYRKALSLGEYSQYDKKGRPKPGVVTEGMRKGREHAMDAKTRGLVDNVRQANTGYAAAQSAGRPFDPRTYPGLRGENLQKPEVAGAMSPELMKEIMQRGTDEQKMGLNAGISSSDSMSGDQVDAVVEVAETATTENEKDSAKTTMKSMVNNVNVVANMSPDQKSNLTAVAYKLGDQRIIGLLHTIMDRVKRSQERRDQV